MATVTHLQMKLVQTSEFHYKIKQCDNGTRTLIFFIGLPVPPSEMEMFCKWSWNFYSNQQDIHLFWKIFVWYACLTKQGKGQKLKDPKYPNIMGQFLLF